MPRVEAIYSPRMNDFENLRPSRRAWLGSALTFAAAPQVLAQSSRDWSGREPVRYPDPDIIALRPQFAKVKINNTALCRVTTGLRWAEGPAWNGVGRYLVVSDIPNNRQMRWLEEDGHVSSFRTPSNYSNGNTFD